MCCSSDPHHSHDEFGDRGHHGEGGFGVSSDHFEPPVWTPNPQVVDEPVWTLVRDRLPSLY